MRVICWPASDTAIDTLKIVPTQQICPATWITRRVPVSLVVARHIAELHGLGGRQ